MKIEHLLVSIVGKVGVAIVNVVQHETAGFAHEVRFSSSVQKRFVDRLILAYTESAPVHNAS